MSREPAEEAAEREYVIDGNTAVDDLLFAQLHADMDKRVLDVLGDVDLQSAQNQALRAAMERANAMLEDESCSSCSEGLESLSSADSLSGGEEGELEDAAGTGEMPAAQLLALPESLLPREVPAELQGGLALVGHVVTVVESLLTLAAAPGGNGVWELGSLCCLANQKVIGYIIDTMGPTERPLYVVQKTCEFGVETGVAIYTSESSALAEVCAA